MAIIAENDIPDNNKFIDNIFSFTYLPIITVTNTNNATFNIVSPLELFFRKILLATTPVAVPIASGNIIIIKIEIIFIDSPVILPETNPITMKNTSNASTSSNAASGIKVFATGPLALYSFTIDKDGAGAVANAIAPKTKAIENGISANIKNATATTINATIPSNRHIITICFPDFLSSSSTSSVPISIPTNTSPILLKT